MDNNLKLNNSQPPAESFEPVYRPPPPRIKTPYTPQLRPKEPESLDNHNNWLYLLVALVVIITLVTLGVIFVSLGNSAEEKGSGSKKETVTSKEVNQEEADKQFENLAIQGNSDEISEIEKDLNDTDLSNLDEKVTSISSIVNNSE